SDHTHSAADITSGTLNDARLSGNVILNGANITRLNNDAGYMTYGDLTISGFITKTLADATYAPINHQHSAADITSGTLSDARLSANVVLSGTNVSRLNNDAGYVSAGALSAAGYMTKTLADATYAPINPQHSAADITSGTLNDLRLSSNVVLSGANVSRLNNDAGYLTASALAGAGFITKTLADATYAPLAHQHSA